MFADAIKPTDTADRILAEVLSGRAALPPRLLSAPLADTVLSIMNASASAATTAELGRRLAQQGMPASAVAALNKALTITSYTVGLSMDDRAAVHALMAEMKRSQGLEFGALAHERAIRRLLCREQLDETIPELDRDGLMVFCAFNDADGHRRRWESLRPPPLADDPLRDPRLTKSWFLHAPEQALTGRPEDFSFFVVDEESGRELVLVECDVRGDRYLGCRETGVALTPLEPASPRRDQALELALRQLDLIVAWSESRILLLDVPVKQPPEVLTLHLLCRQARVRAPFRLGWIDLGQSPEAIRAAYRQTTRQGVRWGRDNIRVVPHHSREIDAVSVFAEIRRTQGRSSGLSPDLLAQRLSEGVVSAYFGFHQDRPACYVLTSRHGDVTYYMASDKPAGSKHPFSHALIDAAIMDARDQGAHRFHFGMLFEGEEFGPKQKNIAMFKRGFASSFEDRVLFTL